jgi:hypothetical protein
MINTEDRLPIRGRYRYFFFFFDNIIRSQPRNPLVSIEAEEKKETKAS